MDEKSGRVSARLGHFSKTDVRFWQERLFRETYRSNGRKCETSHWSARLQHDGRRERFPLYTPNKAAAAAKARDIYLYLSANGWEATLAIYRKSKVVQESKNDRPVTVGEFLGEVFRTASNQRTIEGYSKAFRQIVSQSFGLATGTGKYDYRHGGQSKWLEKIHSVKLTEVTPARVQEWKRSFFGGRWNRSFGATEGPNFRQLALAPGT